MDTSTPVAGGRWPHLLLMAGIVLLAIGSSWGLFVAPREHDQGDVYRILFVHVPTAWLAMLALGVALVCALGSLMGDWERWDARLEAAVEIGVLLSLLVCVQGSLWAKPTWGVWWDWDPRLTTTAIMVMAYGSVVVLRQLVEDPVKRATWSAVSAIVASADLPIVYFSVRWWNSLHQPQSSSSTISILFQWPLRINTAGLLLVVLGLLVLRARLARCRLAEELGPPPSLTEAQATSAAVHEGARS